MKGKNKYAFFFLSVLILMMYLQNINVFKIFFALKDNIEKTMNLKLAQNANPGIIDYLEFQRPVP